MLDELFIYGTRDSVFKQIVNRMPVFNGRYFVAPNYGSELNTSTLETYMKDIGYGIVGLEQKYPIVICLPPSSRPITINSQAYEQMNFSLLFLRNTFTDGQSNSQDVDPDTNVSTLLIEECWSEMKTQSTIFLNILDKTLRGTIFINGVEGPFRSIFYVHKNELASIGRASVTTEMSVTRLSKYNNDNISGVQLNFVGLMAGNTCEEWEAIMGIQITT